MPERVLVTGVLGCLGAWVSRCVLDDGDAVVGYDLGDLAPPRARPRRRRDRVELVKGDITDLPALERALDEHEITRVVHLAALQVPFVRANPPLGMHVNVAGTVNVSTPSRAGSTESPASSYASSTAVYSPSDPSPAPETGGRAGRRCTACPSSPTRESRASTAPNRRPFDRLASLRRLRPGRDQGMTSGPTMAMLAAVRGEPFHIGFSGSAQYDYVPDVARAALTAAHPAAERAAVYNVPGAPADVAEVVAAIHGTPCPGPRSPGAAIRCRSRRAGGRRLRPRRRPVPAHAARGRVAATVAHFRQL